MKKTFITTITLLLFAQFAFAQTASDVIENGIPLKDNQKLFLLYGDKVLMYDVAASLNDPANAICIDNPLEDSTIFLNRKNSLSIFIRPFNPLNYSYATENKIIIDPINEAAATAQGSIIDVFVKVSGTQSTSNNYKMTSVDLLHKKCEDDVDALKKRVDAIQAKLSASKQAAIIETFTKMKSLNFIDEANTIKELASIKSSIAEIEKYFESISKSIDTAKTEIEKYNCLSSSSETFTIKFIFNTILKDLISTLEEQKKRLTNLNAAYTLVEAAQVKASIGGGENLRWCYKLESAPSKEGKISVYTITIKESGYEVVNNEIVSKESKEVSKTTLRVRKFQRFVPEVSVGTAFTFLKYNSYGTTSDSTGQQYVASPTENTIKNLNITTMINWNYYIPNSNIHPFYQLGLGINTGMPTILTGLGIRSNINGTKRLSISGGIAMTWLQELNNLKVGDKVTGTDDINKDFKFSSSPVFTPYIGIQYNIK